ncbi:hypothetical protein PWT90_01373 [Aphanocladium album]|nr:hypothetical protein PWT90_01373 [Aphanocladium album]
MAEKPKHLDPSELGTREYWDKLYTTEIANNTADPEDIGTVWFDDSDAEKKMLEYLARLAGESPESDDEDDDEDNNDSNTATEATLSKETTSFLDLGCGNGSILFALRRDGWSGPLTGVDYSARSIQLASQIASSRALLADIFFAEWDLINGPPLSSLLPPSSFQRRTTWDVVLDKGTFDAISLSDATDARGRRICEGYKARVLPLLERGGLFLITSCNWTEEELRGWFVGGESVDGATFVEVGRVKYRTFSFGGVSGQTISTLCFRKI